MNKIFFSIIFFSFFSYHCSNAQPDKETSNKDTVTIKTVVNLKQDSIKADTLISIIGVGDIMLGTNYPKTPNYLPPNKDCSPLLRYVKDSLQDADLTFGNCEGVFSDDISHARSCGNSKNCYRFSMPEKFAGCFVEAGFDLLSIGNNHVGDLGEYGRKNTVKVLKSKGIHFAGLATHPYTVFEKNGITYGFTAFAPNDGTNKFYDTQKAVKIIQMLDTLADIVIVSMHIGAEGSKYQHLTKKTEYFLGQNRGNPYKFAHLAVDAGADIVFGHGPHVTRAIDVYKNRFIAYSLGNFATYRRFNLSGANGLAPIIKVFVDKNGKFSHAQVVSVYQADGKGPRIDTNNGALKKIQQLTKSDLPELKINISDNGIIRP